MSPRVALKDALRVVYGEGDEWVRLAVGAVLMAMLASWSGLVLLWIVAAALVLLPLLLAVGFWIAVNRARGQARTAEKPVKERSQRGKSNG